MVTISPPALPADRIREAAVHGGGLRYVERALDSYANHDYAAALKAWNKAISLGQRDGIAFFGRGLIHLNLRRFEEALHDLSEADRLEVPEDMQADLHSSRAIALYGTGRIEEALAELDASLQLAPDADILKIRQSLVEELLKGLASTGFASWSGRKAPERTNPARLTSGKSIADLVREGRR